MRSRGRVAALKMPPVEERLENFLQRPAPAENPRFHRAHAAVQNFRDFLITEPFEVAQNHRGAKHIRNVLQSLVHRGLNFQGRKLLERRRAEILDLDVSLPFLRPGIDRNILLQMPLEPALVIQSFANGDAIEPRLQRASPAEIPYAAESLQENFLRAVGGVGSVAEHAEDQVIDRPVIMRDESVEGRLRACLQLVDEFGFVAAPRKGASPIGHCRPFRPDAGARVSLLCQARPRASRGKPLTGDNVAQPPASALYS